MAAKLSITFGAVFSFLLGTFWILAIALPWNWLRSDNAIVSFQVNLFNVFTSPGLGTAVLGGISKMIFGNKDKFSAAIAEFINQTMPIDQAKTTFCLVSVFNWCDMWEKVFWASWIMTILGLTAAALFMVGACCLYYYGNVHATETGRCMTKFFLCMGPLCGLSGIVAYSFLTMEFGKSSDPIMSTGSHSSWGTGWIVAITVTVLSWIPVYILYMFCSVDVNEKKHGDGEDEYLEYGAGGAANFQANGGAVGYGAAGYTQSYGANGQPLPQPAYGLPSANNPGYGAPAW